MIRRRMQIRKGESGSALIPVLALILSASMLVTAALALSQLGSNTMAAHVLLEKSVYVCEGAANRIEYLITAERSVHPDVSLADFDYSESSYDRFPPDGAEHEMDYHGQKVRFTIRDMNGSLDFSDSARESTFQLLKLNSSADTEYTDSLDTVRNLIADYADSDDSVTEDGRETEEYRDSKQLPLPRNGAMQFREEFAWIPEFLALFPPGNDGLLSAVRPFSTSSSNTSSSSTSGGGGGNSGRSSSSRTANMPTLFGAPDLYLKNACSLEDSEVEQVRTALSLLRTERRKLSDTLDGTLLETLKNSPALRWTVGDSYTVEINPSGDEERPARRLVYSFTVSDTVAGPTDGIVRFLEWLYY